jgi:chromosome partitioning protein
MHLAVALLKSGFRVASIDTDSRQRSLTRYIENRASWSRCAGLDLEIPTHYLTTVGAGEIVREVEAQEFAAYVDIVLQIEREFDFVIVDTPAGDSYLMRLSHRLADTLITPINESFIDFDVLARVDPETHAIQCVSHYAALVIEARRQRASVDDHHIDWIVVRNRMSPLENRNRRKVLRGLEEIAARLDLRLVGGVSERVVFRELFLRGLTAFDPLDAKTLGDAPTISHLSARREITGLIHSLRVSASPSVREVACKNHPQSLERGDAQFPAQLIDLPGLGLNRPAEHTKAKCH